MAEVISYKMGEVVSVDVVRSFFGAIFAAEASGKRFPADLDDFWSMPYATKANAKRALEDLGFIEGEDYQVLLVRNDEQVGGAGHNREKIMMTVQCTEHLIARKVRPIFEIYRQCRVALTRQAQLAVERGPWTERFRRSYYDHLVYVRKHCDMGDFTIITALLGDLLSVEWILLQHEIRLFSSDLPDGSIGLRWANHLRNIGRYQRKGDAPLRLFDPMRRVRPAVYALRLLPEYMTWFRGEYLVRGIPEYFDDKFVRRQGVPQLPVDSAKEMVSQNLNGIPSPFVTPATRKLILDHDGIIRSRPRLEAVR